MSEGKTEKLLRALASRVNEPAPSDLADKVRLSIPDPLHAQRWGKDRVSIIIHFKISRLTAVAAIVLTLLVCASFFGGRGGGNGTLVDDLKGLIHLASTGRSDLKGYQEGLKSKGIDVVVYGDRGDKGDPNTILMYWRHADGTYRVVFPDRLARLSAEELIAMQSRMIQDR